MTQDQAPRAWKRPESVLVVVVTRAQQLLLMERTHPEGFWQSVTGSLELGEHPAQAARRELAEETGIDAVPVSQEYFVDFPISEAWRHRYAPNVTRNREHVFTLVLPEPVPIQLNPQEHRQYQWLARDKALELLSSKSNRAAVERLGG